MAGRPPNPTWIVPPNEVLPHDAILQLRFNARELFMVSTTTEATMRWLAKYGLIANERMCDCIAGAGDGTRMGLQRREGQRYIDGHAWDCKYCRSQVNIRKGSFFEGSHLELQQLITLIYYWARDESKSVVMHECKVSDHTAVDWLNFVRDICSQYFLDHPVQLGGPGSTVEIDESKFFHRKYHQGAWREGHWVLGMVERGTNRCVLVKVPDRTANTMLPIIQEHVLPGTRILTDGWQAYNQLANHQFVNHRLHFVDPNDPTLHTNTIEGTWAHCKAKFRRLKGTSSELFESYIQEFMWRRAHGGPEAAFANILYWIRHYY